MIKYCKTQNERVRETYSLKTTKNSKMGSRVSNTTKILPQKQREDDRLVSLNPKNLVKLIRKKNNHEAPLFWENKSKQKGRKLSFCSLTAIKFKFCPGEQTTRQEVVEIGPAKKHYYKHSLNGDYSQEYLN